LRDKQAIPSHQLGVHFEKSAYLGTGRLGRPKKEITQMPKLPKNLKSSLEQAPAIALLPKQP
jgi:hypothetical protein